MVTLFQVSTLSGWTELMYSSWYGCGRFINSPYTESLSSPHPHILQTDLGTFRGFVCMKASRHYYSAFIFYYAYIFITSWVIMALFGKFITL
jgi:hypothetical protein